MDPLDLEVSIVTSFARSSPARKAWHNRYMSAGVMLATCGGILSKTTLLGVAQSTTEKSTKFSRFLALGD